MKAATQPQSSDPARAIPVRRVDFSDAIGRVTRDFAQNDVIMSHFLAALSGLFPDGEEMFVESVRHYRGEITDPDLLRQVNAFIGQEVTHAREHRVLNNQLGALGYRSKLVEQTFQSGTAMTPPMLALVWLATRVGPLRGALERIETSRTHGPDPMFRLAMTTALEHYTATMARSFLDDPYLTELLVDDEFLRFWAWHAIEEGEHRAVAFDVYKAVGGDEELRLRAIRLSGLALVFIAGYHTFVGVLRDPRTWLGLGFVRSLGRLRTNPFLSPAFRAAINDFARTDFHPLQHETSAREDGWKAWVEGSGDRPRLTPQPG